MSFASRKLERNTLSSSCSVERDGSRGGRARAAETIDGAAGGALALREANVLLVEGAGDGSALLMPYAAPDEKGGSVDGAKSGERENTLEEAAQLLEAITAPESLDCECSLPCADAPVPVAEELAPVYTQI